MGKILILEGPDGAGKTCLAGKFSPARIVKCSQPFVPCLAIAEYVVKLRDAKRADGPTVFDRLHVGASIYPAVKRPLEAHTFLDMHRSAIDGILNDKDFGYEARVVLCLPSFETCLADWKKKTEDYLTNEAELWEVYHRYKALAYYYHVVDRDKPAEFESHVEELKEWLA